jgi:hypothetical protein
LWPRQPEIRDPVRVAVGLRFAPPSGSVIQPPRRDNSTICFASAINSLRSRNKSLLFLQSFSHWSSSNFPVVEVRTVEVLRIRLGRPLYLYQILCITPNNFDTTRCLFVVCLLARRVVASGAQAGWHPKITPLSQPQTCRASFVRIRWILVFPLSAARAYLAGRSEKRKYSPKLGGP